MGLIYNAFLPSISDSDVVLRKLKLVVNGEETVLSVNPSVTVLELPPIKDNSSVEISISDVDDAGNQSDYSVPLVFTALDTIVPAVPGAVNVKIVKEVADEVVVAPEPVTPAPAPVVEGEATVTPVDTGIDEIPPPAPEPEPEVSVDPTDEGDDTELVL